MCLGQVSLAVINTRTKSNGEEMVLFVLYLQPITKESRGRNLEAGNEAKAIEGYCLLHFSSRLTQLAFLQQQDHLASQNSTTHSELGPPTSIKKIYHRLAYGPVWLEHFLVELSSSIKTLLCQDVIILASTICKYKLLSHEDE